MSTTITSLVREQVWASIFDFWQPGTPLAISALADGFDASPPAVRRALDAFVDEGLLVVDEAADGYRVVDAAGDARAGIATLIAILDEAVTTGRIRDAREVLVRLALPIDGVEPSELITAIVGEFWISVAATLGPEPVRSANAALLTAIVSLTDIQRPLLRPVVEAMYAMVQAAGSGDSLQFATDSLKQAVDALVHRPGSTSPRPPARYAYRSSAGTIATAESRVGGREVVVRGGAGTAAAFRLEWPALDRLHALLRDGRPVEVTCDDPAAALAAVVGLVEMKLPGVDRIVRVDGSEDRELRISSGERNVLVARVGSATASPVVAECTIGAATRRLELGGELTWSERIDAVAAWLDHLDEGRLRGSLALFERIVGSVPNARTAPLPGVPALMRQFDAPDQVVRHALQELARLGILHLARDRRGYAFATGLPPRRLWQDAVAGLRDMIVDGTLAPGSPLPTFDALSRALHERLGRRFGRKTVAAARRYLERRGLLERRDPRTLLIADTTPSWSDRDQEEGRS